MYIVVYTQEVLLVYWCCCPCWFCCYAMLPLCPPECCVAPRPLVGVCAPTHLLPLLRKPLEGAPSSRINFLFFTSEQVLASSTSNSGASSSVSLIGGSPSPTETTASTTTSFTPNTITSSRATTTTARSNNCSGHNSDHWRQLQPAGRTGGGEAAEAAAVTGIGSRSNSIAADSEAVDQLSFTAITRTEKKTSQDVRPFGSQASSSSVRSIAAPSAVAVLGGADNTTTGLEVSSISGTETAAERASGGDETAASHARDEGGLKGLFLPAALRQRSAVAAKKVDNEQSQPKGILRRDWLQRQLLEKPAAYIICFDWRDACALSSPLVQDAASNWSSDSRTPSNILSHDDSSQPVNLFSNNSGHVGGFLCGPSVSSTAADLHAAASQDNSEKLSNACNGSSADSEMEKRRLCSAVQVSSSGSEEVELAKANSLEQSVERTEGGIKKREAERLLLLLQSETSCLHGDGGGANIRATTTPTTSSIRAVDDGGHKPGGVLLHGCCACCPQQQDLWGWRLLSTTNSSSNSGQYSGPSSFSSISAAAAAVTAAFSTSRELSVCGQAYCCRVDPNSCPCNLSARAEMSAITTSAHTTTADNNKTALLLRHRHHQQQQQQQSTPVEDPLKSPTPKPFISLGVRSSSSTKNNHNGSSSSNSSRTNLFVDSQNRSGNSSGRDSFIIRTTAADVAASAAAAAAESLSRLTEHKFQSQKPLLGIGNLGGGGPVISAFTATTTTTIGRIEDALLHDSRQQQQAVAFAEATALAVVQRIRDGFHRRKTTPKLVLFVVLPVGMPDPQGSVNCFRRLNPSEVAALFVTCGFDDIDSKVERLEQVAYECAVEHYEAEARRYRKQSQHSPRTNEKDQLAAFQNLQMRLLVKAGCMFEVAGQLHASMKAFISAWQLLTSSPPPPLTLIAGDTCDTIATAATAAEKMAVCNFLSLRMYHMYFFAGEPAKAAHHLREHRAVLRENLPALLIHTNNPNHNNKLKKQLLLGFLLPQWLAQLHELFAQMLQIYLFKTPQYPHHLQQQQEERGVSREGGNLVGMMQNNGGLFDNSSRSNVAGLTSYFSQYGGSHCEAALVSQLQLLQQLPAVERSWQNPAFHNVAAATYLKYFCEWLQHAKRQFAYPSMKGGMCVRSSWLGQIDTLQHGVQAFSLLAASEKEVVALIKEEVLLRWLFTVNEQQLASHAAVLLSKAHAIYKLLRGERTRTSMEIQLAHALSESERFTSSRTMFAALANSLTQQLHSLFFSSTTINTLFTTALITTTPTFTLDLTQTPQFRSTASTRNTKHTITSQITDLNKAPINSTTSTPAFPHTYTPQSTNSHSNTTHSTSIRHSTHIDTSTINSISDDKNPLKNSNRAEESWKSRKKSAGEGPLFSPCKREVFIENDKNGEIGRLACDGDRREEKDSKERQKGEEVCAEIELSRNQGDPVLNYKDRAEKSRKGGARWSEAEDVFCSEDAAEETMEKYMGNRGSLQDNLETVQKHLILKWEQQQRSLLQRHAEASRTLCVLRISAGWWPLLFTVLARLLLCVSWLLSVQPPSFLFFLAYCSNEVEDGEKKREEQFCRPDDEKAGTASAAAICGRGVFCGGVLGADVVDDAKQHREEGGWKCSAAGSSWRPAGLPEAATDLENYRQGFAATFQLLNLFVLRSSSSDPSGHQRMCLHAFLLHALLPKLQQLRVATSSHQKSTKTDSVLCITTPETSCESCSSRHRVDIILSSVVAWLHCFRPRSDVDDSPTETYVMTGERTAQSFCAGPDKPPPVSTAALPFATHFTVTGILCLEHCFLNNLEVSTVCIVCTTGGSFPALLQPLSSAAGSADTPAAAAYVAAAAVVEKAAAAADVEEALKAPYVLIPSGKPSCFQVTIFFLPPPLLLELQLQEQQQYQSNPQKHSPQVSMSEPLSAQRCTANTSSVSVAFSDLLADRMIAPPPRLFSPPLESAASKTSSLKVISVCLLWRYAPFVRLQLPTLFPLDAATAEKNAGPSSSITTFPAASTKTTKQHCPLLLPWKAALLQQRVAVPPLPAPVDEEDPNFSSCLIEDREGPSSAAAIVKMEGAAADGDEDLSRKPRRSAALFSSPPPLLHLPTLFPSKRVRESDPSRFVRLRLYSATTAAAWTGDKVPLLLFIAIKQKPPLPPHFRRVALHFTCSSSTSSSQSLPVLRAPLKASAIASTTPIITNTTSNSNSTNINSTNINSTNMNSTSMNSTNMSSTNMSSTNMSSTSMSDTSMSSSSSTTSTMTTTTTTTTISTSPNRITSSSSSTNRPVAVDSCADAHNKVVVMDTSFCAEAVARASAPLEADTTAAAFLSGHPNTTSRNSGAQKFFSQKQQQLERQQQQQMQSEQPLFQVFVQRQQHNNNYHTLHYPHHLSTKTTACLQHFNKNSSRCCGFGTSSYMHKRFRRGGWSRKCRSSDGERSSSRLSSWWWLWRRKMMEHSANRNRHILHRHFLSLVDVFPTQEKLCAGESSSSNPSWKRLPAKQKRHFRERKGSCFSHFSDSAEDCSSSPQHNNNNQQHAAAVQLYLTFPTPAATQKTPTNNSLQQKQRHPFSTASSTLQKRLFAGPHQSSPTLLRLTQPPTERQHQSRLTTTPSPIPSIIPSSLSPPPSSPIPTPPLSPLSQQSPPPLSQLPPPPLSQQSPPPLSSPLSQREEGVIIMHEEREEQHRQERLGEAEAPVDFLVEKKPRLFFPTLSDGGDGGGAVYSSLWTPQTRRNSSSNKDFVVIEEEEKKGLVAAGVSTHQHSSCCSPNNRHLKSTAPPAQLHQHLPTTTTPTCSDTPLPTTTMTFSTTSTWSCMQQQKEKTAKKSNEQTQLVTERKKSVLPLLFSPQQQEASFYACKSFFNKDSSKKTPPHRCKKAFVFFNKHHGENRLLQTTHKTPFKAPFLSEAIACNKSIAFNKSTELDVFFFPFSSAQKNCWSENRSVETMQMGSQIETETAFNTKLYQKQAAVHRKNSCSYCKKSSFRKFWSCCNDKEEAEEKENRFPFQKKAEKGDDEGGGDDAEEEEEDKEAIYCMPFYFKTPGTATPGPVHISVELKFNPQIGKLYAHKKKQRPSLRKHRTTKKNSSFEKNSKNNTNSIRKGEATFSCSTVVIGSDKGRSSGGKSKSRSSSGNNSNSSSSSINSQTSCNSRRRSSSRKNRSRSRSSISGDRRSSRIRWSGGGGPEAVGEAGDGGGRGGGGGKELLLLRQRQEDFCLKASCCIWIQQPLEMYVKPAPFLANAFCSTARGNTRQSSMYIHLKNSSCIPLLLREVRLVLIQQSHPQPQESCSSLVSKSPEASVKSGDEAAEPPPVTVVEEVSLNCCLQQNKGLILAENRSVVLQQAEIYSSLVFDVPQRRQGAMENTKKEADPIELNLERAKNAETPREEEALATFSAGSLEKEGSSNCMQQLISGGKKTENSSSSVFSRGHASADLHSSTQHAVWARFSRFLEDLPYPFNLFENSQRPREQLFPFSIPALLAPRTTDAAITIEVLHCSSAVQGVPFTFTAAIQNLSCFPQEASVQLIYPPVDRLNLHAAQQQRASSNNNSRNDEVAGQNNTSSAAVNAAESPFLIGGLIQTSLLLAPNFTRQLQWTVIPCRAGSFSLPSVRVSCRRGIPPVVSSTSAKVAEKDENEGLLSTEYLAQLMQQCIKGDETSNSPAEKSSSSFSSCRSTGSEQQVFLSELTHISVFPSAQRSAC